MANTSATITLFPYPKGIDNTQRMQILRGTISLVAGTYPAGGIPLSWASLSNVDGESPTVLINTSSGPFPVEVDVFSSAYNADGKGFGNIGPSGYIYVWDSVNGNLHIFETWSGNTGFSGPLLELAGPVPSVVLNDVIQFTAIFTRT